MGLEGIPFLVCPMGQKKCNNIRYMPISQSIKVILACYSKILEAHTIHWIEKRCDPTSKMGGGMQQQTTTLTCTCLCENYNHNCRGSNITLKQPIIISALSIKILGKN